MKDLRAHVAKRVIVETDALTIEGVIHRAFSDGVELTNCHVLSDEGGRRPMDGLIVVPDARIAYVQVL